jgi:hypothetical protein
MGTLAVNHDAIKEVNPVPASSYTQFTTMPILALNIDPTTSWANSLLARVYHHLNRTDQFQKFLHTRITRKVLNLKRPPILGPIHVKDIVTGNRAPVFHQAQLLRLTGDGSMECAIDLHYPGGFQVTIESVANLVTQIPLTVTVRIDKIQGKLLLRFKPLPSNRLWYGFFAPGPIIEMDIKTTVSDTHVNIAVIKSAIEKRLIDNVRENLILPHMDNIELPLTECGEIILHGGTEKRGVTKSSSQLNSSSSSKRR